MRKKAPAPVAVLDAQASERSRARRNALVVEHLDLVPPIARAIANTLPPSFDIDDLVAAGNLALVDAADRFRPSEHGGAPFSAYARQKVRGAILDSVRRRHYRNATLEPTEAGIEPAMAPLIETSIDDGRLRRKVREAIGWLPAHEQALLDEYYSPAEPDLRAVGVVLEISRGKAKKVHREAIAHIRHRLRIDGTAA